MAPAALPGAAPGSKPHRCFEKRPGKRARKRPEKRPTEDSSEDEVSLAPGANAEASCLRGSQEPTHPVSFAAVIKHPCLMSAIIQAIAVGHVVLHWGLQLRWWLQI